MSNRLSNAGGTADQSTSVIPFPIKPIRSIPKQPKIKVRSKPQLVSGTAVDPKKLLRKALCDHAIAKAERELAEALWLADWYDDESKGEQHDDARERAFHNLRFATAYLARTPAPTKGDLQRKRRAIGNIWLKIESTWGEWLRECVAADEERLSQ